MNNSIWYTSAFVLFFTRHCASRIKKRTEEATPFGVSLMRSQVLYRAAQVLCKYAKITNKLFLEA